MSAPVDHRTAMPIRRRPGRWLALFTLGLLLALMAALGCGASDVGPAALLHPLDWSARERLVLVDIRLPRALFAGLVGGALALAGAMIQGLFRNPLADPSLIGISSGAALGAVLAITFDLGRFGFATLPLAAFLGALAATLTLTLLARRDGRTVMAVLLLAGIALAALVSAVLGVIVFAADDRKLRDITFWSLGSLSGIGWPAVMIAAPVIAGVVLIAPRLAPALNALLLGEAEALYLGIPVERVKRLIIVLTAAAVGVAVAFTGVIGFVGVVVPHIARLTLGPDHRLVLPGSLILGAALLLLADLIARLVVIPAELPVGIVTAALGAPFFLWLLCRRQGGLRL